MSATAGRYLNKRLLRINVGFLLSEGPGNAREIPLDFSQRVQVDEDLFLGALTGRLILTRTKEGILVQGELNVTHERECDRCLDEFKHRFGLDIAELFASPPDANKSVFSVDSNGEIDLAPLLREEVLIEASYRVICQDSCRGLCAETGDKLVGESSLRDRGAESAEEFTEIDPRIGGIEAIVAVEARVGRMRVIHGV